MSGFSISIFFSHVRLTSILRQKKVPTNLIRWTKTFLTARQTAMCLDGRMGEMRPVNTGVPQGSPVSPILAAFAASPLCEKVQSTRVAYLASWEEDGATRVGIIIYVDDGNIYVSSRSLQTNTEILTVYYSLIVE